MKRILGICVSTCVIFLFITVTVLASYGSIYDIGGTSYWSDSTGNSGSAYDIGGMSFNNSLNTSCPLFSTYDPLTRKCKCNTGYKVDILGKSCTLNFSSPSNFKSQDWQTSVLNLDITPPADVKNLTAIAGDKKVNLFWTAATDNVGIKNYLITFDSKPIDLSKYNPTSTPNVRYCEKESCYTDGLINGVTYYFYVLPFDASGNYSKYWSNVAATKPLDVSPPNSVEGVKIKVVGKTMSLNWNTAQDNEGALVIKCIGVEIKVRCYPTLPALRNQR